MNNNAEVLLRNAKPGPLVRPNGEVIISSFPFIFDCPDFMEELTQISFKDYQPGINKQKGNIEQTVNRNKEAI